MDLMQRRRELIAMQTGGLPGAYQKIDYIETSGTQYIDTSYTPINGDTFSLDFLFTQYSNSASVFQCLAASKNQDPQVQFIFGTDSQGHICFYKYFSSGQAKKVYYDFVINTIYHIDVAANGDITIGNVTVSPLNNSGYATGPIRLFLRSTGGVAFYGRLYNFTIKHGGANVLNLIPCVRKSDSKPGMYDTVTKTFYTNAGTGEFIVPA